MNKWSALAVAAGLLFTSVASATTEQLRNGRFFDITLFDSDSFQINFPRDHKIEFGYIHFWDDKKKSLFRMVYDSQIKISYEEIAAFQRGASVMLCVDYHCQMERSERFFQKLANVLCQSMPSTRYRNDKIFCAPRKGIFPGGQDTAYHVQKLLDAAPKTRQALYFPPGRYKFNRSIRLSDGCSLLGSENMLTIFDASESFSTLSLSNQYYDNIIHNTEYNNIVFDNMSLDLLGGTSNIKISGNIFHNTRKQQAQLHIGHGSFEVSNNVFLRGDSNPGERTWAYKNYRLSLRDNYWGDLTGSFEANYLGSNTLTRLLLLTTY